MAALRSSTLLNFFILCIVLSLLKVECKQNLVNLNENNWRDMLEGEWMVEFYAPWCPACKSLQPVWNEFSNLGSNILKIRVGQVDVTTSPGLSGRFMVTALPTIYHVINGEFRQYKGGRDKEALISFIKDKKWTSIEPIPSWLSPSSFLKSVASYVFKLSTVLRSIYNHLLEEFGLPSWGSYLILALATLCIGTFLGLILVCIIDCISPPNKKHKNSKKEEVDEVDEGDDIIDENDVNEEESQSETKSEERISQDEDEDDEDENKTEREIEEKTEESLEVNKSIRKRKPRKAM